MANTPVNFIMYCKLLCKKEIFKAAHKVISLFITKHKIQYFLEQGKLQTVQCDKLAKEQYMKF